MAAKLNADGIPADCVVDIPEINEQYRDFFSLLAKIGEMVPDLYKPLNDEEVDIVVDILSELRDSLVIHFDTEESFMREVEYPGLTDQKSEHDRFLTDVIRMEAELMNGSSVPAITVQSFAQDWHRDHFLEHDRPFNSFYSKAKR